MSNTRKSMHQGIESFGQCRFKNTLRTHFELGRVSNLPTVWSNVFCAVVVASALLTSSPGFALAQGTGSLLLPVLILAMSAFYTAGMYLNDACDAAIDKIERAARPIPSGRISRSHVFIFTGLWFVTGWVFLWLSLRNSATTENPFSLVALSTAAGLTGCIIIYDFFHKNNPASPAIMGMCRVLLICTSYLCVIAVLGNGADAFTSIGEHQGLWLVCLLILCYLCGLTFLAKFENSKTVISSWPVLVLLVPVVYGAYQSMDNVVSIIPTMLLLSCVFVAVGYVREHIAGGIPKAIGLLIAGISLIDAIIMSTYGSYVGMCFGIAAFLLTLLFQRKIAGT